MRTLTIFSVIALVGILSGCGKPDVSKGPSVTVRYGEDWYGSESSGTDTWSWSSGQSTIVLENLMQIESNATLRFDLHSLTNRTLELVVNGASASTIEITSPDWISVEMGVNLRSGESILFISSEAPGVTPMGEDRDLRFCVRNIELIRDEKNGAIPAQLPLVYSSGWHDLESDGIDSWRWSKSPSRIVIHNGSEAEGPIFGLFEVRSLTSRSFEVSLNGREISSETLEAGDWLADSVELNLNPGVNVLEFSTKESGTRLQGDSRELYFCIRNFALSTSDSLQLEP